MYAREETVDVLKHGIKQERKKRLMSGHVHVRIVHGVDRR